MHKVHITLQGKGVTLQGKGGVGKSFVASLLAQHHIESGTPVEHIKSLADLVRPERFKVILRHYHERAGRKPNAFVICLAKTLIQAAQYHVGATTEEIGQLKRFA